MTAADIGVSEGRECFRADDACPLVCFRRQKTTESAGSDEEDVDELSLIDHKEIMSRITLKQEVRPPLMTCLESGPPGILSTRYPVSPALAKGHCESLASCRGRPRLPPAV